MKYIYLSLVICFNLSCSKDDFRRHQSSENKTRILLSNYTGHWNEKCSPGQVLIFSITANQETKEFEIQADKTVWHFSNLQEGDYIEIKVYNKKRDLLHFKNKSFYPSNPEVESPYPDRRPLVEVCDIGRLEVSGF